MTRVDGGIFSFPGQTGVEVTKVTIIIHDLFYVHFRRLLIY